ncbi:MAG: phosphoglycerate kinase [Candidatus Melainabacteria bacterium]|jgi:phosphoglycerate kinase|nr:phosphoglycerate kinase [Candidatus Melainabacteria bacterium]
MVKTIKDLDKKELGSKRVLVRVDFNVPLRDGVITDDSRIVAALPSIKYLMANNAKIILVSHLGRPKGQVVEALRLNPVATRLSELLGKAVIKFDTATGAELVAKTKAMKDADVALLENIRFYPGEEANDVDFAKELSELADLYVNDAFGAAHRAHASTQAVSSYLSPAVAGLLMHKEVEMLGSKLNHPERPFTAIIGGAKVSSKISVLKKLVPKVDTIIIGGGMAFTFLKAQGGQIGQSICEDDHLDTAREILSLADQFNTAIILPTDNKTTSNENIFEKHQTSDKIETETCASNQIPQDRQGMDIGPESVKQFVKIITQSKTILWNGPMGVFEYDVLENGTKAVALALVELTSKGGTTIVGGGDSVAALEKFGISKNQLTHISTGGGASLEFLEGKTLPGLACLDGYSSSTTEEAEKPHPSFAEELKKASV